MVSGGVASNLYLRKTLKIVTDATGLHLLCPPSKLCTDNGVMIAWYVCHSHSGKDFFLQRNVHGLSSMHVHESVEVSRLKIC